uniref:solute carrier family 51 subunit beta n=1 Tax=Scatophagus argus TaxID=75038 RepID=UPI001ED843D4|nr:solute carrier family 51 subunit beta [Scatophagus argus]
MFNAWMLLFPLLLGTSSFMIHNTQHSLCLEDSAATGEVLLKKCNLESESQQWMWISQGMLMCVASSRCLSAMQREPLQTQACWGPKVEAAALMWDCDNNRLISRNTSMLLSIDGQQLVFTHESKHSKWRSLDEGDICQEKLRSRRESKDLEEFEAAGEQTGKMAALTKEQREYLQWYYRTEDPTTWKFVLLGLAFICLLVGFLLLGMGAMANKNRKEIAKYKAVAAAMTQKSEGEELLVISPLGDDSNSKPSPSLDRPLQGNKASPFNGEVSELKAGNIVVTWKDGNTSCLYSDPADDEFKQVEVPAVQLEVDEAVKTME